MAVESEIDEHNARVGTDIVYGLSKNINDDSSHFNTSGGTPWIP